MGISMRMFMGKYPIRVNGEIVRCHLWLQEGIQIETRESKHVFLGKQPDLPPTWRFHHKKNADRPIDHWILGVYLNLQKKNKKNKLSPYGFIWNSRVPQIWRFITLLLQLPLKWGMPQLFVCVLHMYLQIPKHHDYCVYTKIIQYIIQLHNVNRIIPTMMIYDVF